MVHFYLTIYTKDIDKMQVFPNPFSSQLHITLVTPQSKQIDLILLTTDGRRIQAWTSSMDRDYFNKVLTLPNIPSGNYLLHLSNKDKTLSIVQLIKQ